MTPRRHGILMFMMFWAAIFLVLVFWFERVIENRINPNRAVLLAEQGSEIVLKKNIRGQFTVEGFINGVLVNMIVDTGASFVAIPEAMTGKLQVKETGDFSRVSTANGDVIGKDLHIDSLQIGGLLFQDVSGISIPKIEEETILLGMNVLRNLNLHVSGDTMRMEPLQAVLD